MITVIPGPGVLSGDRLTITQAGHGLSATDWAMYNTDTETWVALDVTTPMTEGVHGVACRYVVAVSGNDLTLQLGGVYVAAHGLPVGPLYATTTGGTVSATMPGIGAIRWLVGIVHDVDYFSVLETKWIQQ